MSPVRYEIVTPPSPPLLPARFYESLPVIGGGMVLWLLVGVVAFVVAGAGELFWTCVSGLGVGIFGLGVFLAQRAAARRGDRSAQRGIEPR